MRSMILIALCLMLASCSALPNIETNAPGTPEQVTSEVTQEAATDPYASFLQETMNADKVALFLEYFSDINTDNASYFFLSAAIAELNGDETPEILLTFTNDIAHATAQSYTQIFTLKQKGFEKFGGKLSGAPSFYKAGRLLLTRVDGVQSQGFNQYGLVDITDQVRVIESGEYTYYYATAAKDERAEFDYLAGLAKAQVIGSTDENIRVIWREDRLINLLMFNDRQYSADKALAMQNRLLDMKRVNAQPLNENFVMALPDYQRYEKPDALIDPELAKDLTDQLVRSIDAKLTDPNFTRIQAGGNEYVVESTQITMSTDLFQIIHGTIDGKQVYFRNNLPVYYRSNKLGYYANDENLSEVFAQIRQQFEKDVTRYYLSEFFLTDAYSGTLPWPLYQSEYFK